MGFFSFLTKPIEKIWKGIKKVGSKIVSGIKKVGKKVMGGIGKVMGKLGPIGTIALAIVAPYAAAAMAASSIGWISALGQGMQAIGATIAAPFKAVGQAAGTLLGKAAGSLGSAIGENAIGNAFTSISDKLINGLGGGANSVSEAFSNTWNGVKDAWTGASDAWTAAQNGWTGNYQPVKDTAWEAMSDQQKMLYEQDYGNPFDGMSGEAPVDMSGNPYYDIQKPAYDPDMALGSYTDYAQGLLAPETAEAFNPTNSSSLLSKAGDAAKSLFSGSGTSAAAGGWELPSLGEDPGASPTNVPNNPFGPGANPYASDELYIVDMNNQIQRAQLPMSMWDIANRYRTA